MQVLVKRGDVVTPGTVILTYEPSCLHSIVIHDLCAECGVDLSSSISVNTTVHKGDAGMSSNLKLSMLHSMPELRVSMQEALRIGKQEMNSLLRQRKLELLLDLDETLVNTTCDRTNPNLKGIHRYLVGPVKTRWLQTSLRPGVREFLREVSKLYRAHIFSYGEREYTHFIARLLDPDGSIFGERILSRDEFTDANMKTTNLKSIFPCGVDMVAIVDDRSDVWQDASNLLVAPPYEFFRKSRSNALSLIKRNVAGWWNFKSSLESDDVVFCMDKLLDMVDRPCYFPSLLSTLTTLHNRFYSLQRGTVQSQLTVHSILTDIRSSILRDKLVYIMASPHWPVSILRDMVIKLGGQLVATLHGADVVIGCSRHCVKPDWLFDCLYYHKWQDPSAYRSPYC